MQPLWFSPTPRQPTRDAAPLTGHAPAPLRLVLLGAHPDDIEIGLGGSLLTLAGGDRPLDVTWVVLSGSPPRDAEARAAARAFLQDAHLDRLDLRVLDFPDARFPGRLDSIKDAVEEVRAAASGGGPPDIVFTHARHDRHQDHRVLSDLAYNTWRDSLILEYEIPKVDADLLPPNTYIPISEAHARRKAALLQEHFPSQRARPWFDADLFLGLMRLRGGEAGSPTRYAEGFHCRKLVLTT